MQYENDWARITVETNDEKRNEENKIKGRNKSIRFYERKHVG